MSSSWDVLFFEPAAIQPPRQQHTQGNYDLQDGPTGNLAWLTELPWTGNAAFRAAKRWVWKVDGKRAGYVKQARTLRHIVVLNAGHMVPRDQGACCWRERETAGRARLA